MTQADRRTHPDAPSLAEALMFSILNSGNDRPRQIDDLGDLVEKILDAARIIGDERACMIADEQIPGEAKGTLGKRLGGLSATRVGQLLERAQQLRAEDAMA